MRIACVGYRAWALSIYDHLAREGHHQFLIIRSREQYDEQVIRDFKPELILYYGWSWIVPASMIDDFNCIMLHPSPLPKYRGGSPIQNQIIRGERVGAVTLILMDHGLDTGPILKQMLISLEGTLSDVFDSMTTGGIELTRQLIAEGLNPVSQRESDATSFRRRLPEDSEITLEELTDCSAEYLYNKIRMLAPPYPEAFFRTYDGKKLVISRAYIADEKLGE